MKKILIILFLLFATNNSAASDGLRRYFLQIQQAIYNNDARTLVKYIPLPIRVWIDDKFTVVENKKEFIELYPKIFDDKFRKFILEYKYEYLRENWRGISIGCSDFYPLTNTGLESPYQLYLTGGIGVETIINTTPTSYDPVKIYTAHFYNPKGREVIEPCSEEEVKKFISLLRNKINEDTLKDLIDKSHYNCIEVEGNSLKALGEYTYLYFADVNNDGKDNYVLVQYYPTSMRESVVVEVYDINKDKLSPLNFEQMVFRTQNISQLIDFHMHLYNPFLVKLYVFWGWANI